MTEPVICEETFGRHGPCRNRARWLVVTHGWTMKLCGVHAGGYRRDLARNGGPGLHAYVSGVKSVTPLTADGGGRGD